MSESVLRDLGDLGEALASPAITALEGAAGSLASTAGSGWRSRLQPASFRGVSFAVLGQEHRAGRRVAVHEYAFRDNPWPEDLGRAVRAKRVNGFLVGDDAIERRAAMRRAAETRGTAELVLPTEGRITVTLVGYSDSETWDEGRVVRFRLEVVEGGGQGGSGGRGLTLEPAAVRDTRAAVGEAADAAADASSRSWLRQIGDGLRAGYTTAKGVVDSVKPYVATATRLVGDASRVVGAVRGLAGGFGRFSFGRRSSVLGAAQGVTSGLRGVETRVRGVIGAATTARDTVERAAGDVVRLANLL